MKKKKTITLDLTDCKYISELHERIRTAFDFPKWYLSANSSIIMDGELNLISGQNYENFSSRNFIRLLDGVNNLTVIGNVSSIKIEYSARRML